MSPGVGAVIRRGLHYLGPYRLVFGLALLQVFLMSALELARPWPLQVVIDHLLGGQPAPALVSGLAPGTILLVACAGLVLIAVLSGGLSIWSQRTSIRIGQRMVTDLRRDLYVHLHRLSPSFHSRREVGDLLYRVTADTFAVQTLAMNCLFPALSAAMLLVGMSVIMFRMDPELTFLALAVCPALLVAIRLLDTPISVAATRMRQEESAVFSVVQRAMSSVPLIQAFTREDDENRRFMARSMQSLAAGLRLYTWQTVYSGAVTVLMAAGTAAVLWVGTQHVREGRLTVGEMVVFFAYLASLYAPVNSVVQSWGVARGALAGLRRVFEILDVERDVPEGSRVLTPGTARGDVAWEGVRFEYAPGQPVLRNVTLRVPAGSRVAIVGPTGAGKSTLMALLARFADPQEGRITLGGVDVREYTLRSLRQQVAMMLQPPVVLPVSIAENIALGRPEANREEIAAAARVAGIHDAIRRLPAGYDTMVGEQGVTLSEGEKQRITIARAVLKDSPILVLDEPTSAVDAETERVIMDGLGRLSEGRTTFIIAHRLSTVQRCDLVVVIRDGGVAEQGTFQELVDQDGLFARLYRLQMNAENGAPLIVP
ncbi:MAG TPA: ABC transporter ATP-binding protein [Candidatus Binatia bacterium]|nr:ABC transporter ATP-binding protein [Candidatus Binatia bacterium]